MCNKENFEFYTDEQVNTLQTYIEEHYTLDGTSKHLIRNILEYVATQDDDEENILYMLTNLLDGIGITEDEIVNAVVSELDYATKKAMEEVKEIKFPSIDDIKKDYNEVIKIIKGNKDEKSIEAINKEYGIDYMLYHNDADLCAVNYSNYGNLRNIFYNLKNDEVRFDVWLDEIDDNFIGEIAIEELTQEEYEYCKEITIENTVELFKSKYENRSLLEKASPTSKEKEYER